MRRIDQGIDAFFRDIIGKAIRAAKTTDPNRHGMRNRRGRAAGERQGDIKADAPGEPFAQQACLGGAAENKDTCQVFCHVF